MKEVSFLGKIIKGDVEIANPGYFEEKYKRFIFKNKNNHVEVTYKIVDKASHSFYKAYWGILLPAITEAMGEDSQEYVHYALKREFMYNYAISLDEIPRKYRGKCQVDMQEIDGKLIVKGYVKSTSTYTKEEFKTFLKKCEDRLTFLNGGIQDKEYLQYRKNIRG